jgi:aryl-alcohol dehydrogenase-like predicted oxidoreductase
MTTHSAYTQVQGTRLGRTGMNVSRIAFGTWQLGGDWGATDEQAAIGAIRHAYDLVDDAVAAAGLELSADVLRRIDEIARNAVRIAGPRPEAM